ncbi:MAG TPA: hypothetical protein VG412_07675 [Acidimicrobiales bacterium]|jgi:hypothetical protein|nr:hypothetical protein [Acidimicrobiales bacterium]
MSTVQRWQTPACLSLVLIAAILFVFSLGLRTELRPVATGQTPVAAVTPAPTVCPTTAAATTVATPPPTPPPAPIGINQNVSGSSNLAVAGRGNQTQGNDGGFGDVGLQFQNVNVLAPINIVHISNEGSGNTNNVNIGPGGPVTTTTPTTVDPSTPAPAAVDPSTTPTTDPNATPTTIPTRVWTPPTATTTTTDPSSTTTAATP